MTEKPEALGGGGEKDGRPRHPIGVAASRTGLTPSAIRVWERRYRAVEPERTEGGHRLYSEAQIERLDLLHRLTEHGHRISGVAPLPTPELRDLLHRMEGPVREETGPSRPPGSGRDLERVRKDALEAIQEFDAEALDALLRRAALSRSTEEFVDALLVPLMREVGKAWEVGKLGPAQEHMATAVVTRVSGWLLDHLEVAPDAPGMVVATPPGQEHALGALWAGVLAAAAGWRVTYLGGNLPAREIASAARSTGARAVALGLVYPRGDEAVADELRALARDLPDGTALLAGGSGAGSYAPVLDEVGARRVEGYDALAALLEEVAGARL